MKEFAAQEFPFDGDFLQLRRRCSLCYDYAAIQNWFLSATKLWHDNGSKNSFLALKNSSIFLKNTKAQAQLFTKDIQFFCGCSESIYQGNKYELIIEKSESHNFSPHFLHYIGEIRPSQKDKKSFLVIPNGSAQIRRVSISRWCIKLQFGFLWSKRQ